MNSQIPSDNLGVSGQISSCYLSLIRAIIANLEEALMPLIPQRFQKGWPRHLHQLRKPEKTQLQIQELLTRVEIRFIQ